MSNKLSKIVLGKEFKNPIILASGTINFGRELSELYPLSKVGGMVCKGLTREPRLGNPPARIAETSSGIINSIGLQNPGVDAFIRDELEFFTSQGNVGIANVCGNTTEDYQEVARRISETNIDLIELNISCPNVKEGGMSFGVKPEFTEKIVRDVKPYCKQPLIVKLTPNVSNIAEIAKAAEQGGADAISLINTLAAMAIDDDAPVLANRMGGLSGPAIKPIALKMTNDVYKAVKIPVIGMGGISNCKDVRDFMWCGASLVQAGTINMTNPLAVPKMVDDLQQYFEDKNIKNTDEIIGQLR